MAELYYGVSLPPDPAGAQPDTQLEIRPVYTDQAEVMRLLKVYKSARFKVFRSEEEARQFSARQQQIDSQQLKPPSTPIPGESCEFKSLKPQELVQFRRAVENSNLDFIRECVMCNPRYMVTTSDSPSVLHEGSRSNALHMAAKLGKTDSATLVLSFVKGDLLERMYPDEDPEQNMKRRDHLLDLYLNMPDKGGGDTPLHLASKFGHVDMVALLVSFPATRTEMINKFGETPSDVACSRIRAGTEETSSGPKLAAKIRELLVGQLFIPLYRELDSGPATIGHPVSVKEAPFPVPSVPPAASTSVSVTTTPLRACTPPISGRRLIDTGTPRSPAILASPVRTPNSQCSSSSSPVYVSGLLGPVSRELAPQLYRQLRHSPAKERLADPARGLERQGRGLARQTGAGWLEYWPFLADYADLSGPAGWKLLEAYLAQRAAQLARQEAELRCRELFQDEEEDEEVFSGELEILAGGSALSPMSRLAAGLDSLSLKGQPSTASEDREWEGGVKSAASGDDDGLEQGGGSSGPGGSLAFVGPACRMLAQLIADGLPASHSDQDILEASLGLLPHWENLRRQVNNMKSDPAGRWAGLDYSALFLSLVEGIHRELELELGDSDLDEVTSNLERLGSMDIPFNTKSSGSVNQLLDGGLRERKVSGRDYSKLRGLQPLATVLAACVQHRSVPASLDLASVWNIPVQNTAVATEKINRARQFFHSKVMSDFSGSSSSSHSASFTHASSQYVEDFTAFNQAFSPQRLSSRRDSLGSQGSSSSEYGTPPASPTPSSLYTADEGGLAVWIEGQGPTQTDRQVREALDGVDISDLEEYPNLLSYILKARSFSQEEMKRWPSQVKNSSEPRMILQQPDLDQTY